MAILIGVTIGGIYMYIGKSRINTDANNVSTLQSAMQAAMADVHDPIYANYGIFFQSDTNSVTVGDSIDYTNSDRYLITRPTTGDGNWSLELILNPDTRGMEAADAVGKALKSVVTNKSGKNIVSTVSKMDKDNPFIFYVEFDENGDCNCVDVYLTKKGNTRSSARWAVYSYLSDKASKYRRCGLYYDFDKNTFVEGK